MKNGGKWKSVRLGELAEFRNGVNYNKSSFGTGIKVVGVKDFQDYTKPKFETLEEINPEGIVSDRNLLHHEDIVFVRSNGNRELIGRSLFIEHPPEDVTHSAFSIRLRFTSDKVHPRFYAYVFRTSLIRQGLSSHGGGTNISNLNQDILNRLEVPLPDLPTQRKIAGILSTYDDLIENNLRRVRILEEIAQSLYREWFVHFRFPGHESAKMTDSSLGPIPEGWGWIELNELGFVGRGRSRHRPRNERSLYGGKYPFFQTGDVKSAQNFLWVNSQTYSEAGLAQSKLWEPGTLCITIAANIADTAILAKEACFPGSVVGFIPNREKTNVFFVMMFLKTIKQSLQNVSRGTTQDNLSLEKLLGFKVLHPDIHTRKRFEEHVTPFFDQQLELLKKNQILCQTRDLLLPKFLAPN